MDKGKKILIIDDAMLMRNLLKNILGMKGYTICGEAETGEEGIELYKKVLPDLTICDINMAGMNGIECLRQILEMNPSAKVVMCTSMGERCFAEEAVEIGAKGYIVKPVAAAAVVATVDKVINQEDHKDKMLSRALAAGLSQKEILDFFSAFRSVTQMDLGHNAVNKEFLLKQKESVMIGAEAFLASSMSLDKIKQLVTIFANICEEA